MNASRSHLSVIFLFFLYFLLPCRPALAQPIAQPAVAPPGVSIEWSVFDRFRLFRDDPGVVAKADQLLQTLASYPNLKSAYPAYYKILQAQAGSLNLYEHTNYRKGPGDYGRTDHDLGYVAPAAQLIDVWLTGNIPPDALCTWYVDSAEVQSNVGCRYSARLRLPYPQGQFRYAGVVRVVMNGQEIRTEVQTHDTLVVSMGDSYAAGEGSPDRPTEVSKLSPVNPYSQPKSYLWWSTPKGGTQVQGSLPESASADWWSLECHRSLFSPHAIAAMKLAATDRHNSITYLSYACSGAAVLDGLLTRQAEPPGKGHIDQQVEDHGGDGVEGLAQTDSQLSRAVADLCAVEPRSEPYGFKTSDAPKWREILRDHNRGEDGRPGKDPGVPVCDQWIRQPDAIFLTIGGNDVGFAGLASWALTPENFGPGGDKISELAAVFTWAATAIGQDLSWNGLGMVCPWQPYGESFYSHLPIIGPSIGSKDPRCNPPPVSGNLGARYFVEKELPRLLQITQDFFRRSGIDKNAAVIQEAYPSPLQAGRGIGGRPKFCGEMASPFDTTEQMREPWLAEESEIPPQLTAVTIYLREQAAKDVDQIAFSGDSTHPSLLMQLRAAAAQNPKWKLAETPPEFLDHGICATSGNFSADFGFPRWNNSVSPASWTNAAPAPSAWQPYLPERMRWLRTANDSLLTQAVSDINGNILPESLSGTIHPTANGQAAVADQILSQLLAYRAAGH